MSELSTLMDADVSEVLFGRMLDGQMSDMAIAELLIQIGERGETPGEVIGAARAMRKRMVQVAAPNNAIDVCGTGGDGQHSLNIQPQLHWWWRRVTFPLRNMAIVRHHPKRAALIR
jgi:anthranilate phosphoribosyltransferase